MKNNKQPAIRLAGHAGKWKWKKLNEISTKVTEKNKDNLYSETLTNSAEFGIVSQRDFFEKDISNVKNLNGYYVVRPDDFVYNPRISNFAPVGPIKRNKLNRTGVMSPLYYVFRTKEIDNSFLERYFSSKSWHLFMKLNGDSGARSDRFAIKDVVFGEMPIPFPSLEEQKEIGDFFHKLEETIILHQQELDTLKQTKQGFLQKMFPKEGESVPEIRFSGFTGDWKKYSLKDLAKVGTGKAFESTDFIDDGEYLVITNKNILDQTNGIVSRGTRINISDQNVLKKYVLSGENVLVTMDGVNIGVTGKYSNDKAVLAQRVGRLNSKQIEFIYQVTKSSRFIAEMNKLSVGNAIKHISLNQISNYSFMAPVSEEEQEKIGEFFKKIDRTIALHQQEFDALKQTKKAFLQKMFV